MSDKEVLEKAFSIVKRNGYKGDVPMWDDQMRWWYVSDNNGGYVVQSITEILFSHQFAKALWLGESDTPRDGDDEGPMWLMNFEYHLQKMVLAKDRIGYLRDYMPE